MSDRTQSGLVIDGLTVVRSGAVVVDAARFAVAPGEVVALIGGNGAGKSSLLRAIAGADPVRGGTVRLDGRDLSDLALEQRVRAGIGWCPEGRRLFPGLTVEETLDVAALDDRGRRSAAIARVLELFPVLSERRTALAWTLSGGQQQMLTIARALVSSPKAILLDEPSLGLAPVVLDDVFAAVARMAGDGLAVLLAEQNVPRALAVADRVLVMRRGVIALDLPADRLTPEAAVLATLDASDDAAYEEAEQNLER